MGDTNQEYLKADSSVYACFLQLIEETFPELSGYSFGLLFRTKIKKSRGNMILASITQPTKLMSYYAKDDNGEPFDFIMMVDEMVWACAKDNDRIRLIRHELRHVFIDEKGKCKLVDHDFQDFHAEVALNTDDPNWTHHLAEVAQAGYKQVKDGQKDPRLDRRDADDLKPVENTQRQVQIEAAIEITEEIKNKMAKDAADKITTAAVKGTEGVKGVVDKKPVAKTDSAVIPSNKKVKIPETERGMKLDDLARKRGLLPQNGKKKAPAPASAI